MSQVRAIFVLLAAAAALVFTSAVTMDDFGLFAALLALLLGGLCLIGGAAPKTLLLQTGLVVLAVSTRHLAGIALGTQALALLASRTALVPAALMALALVLLGLTGGSLDLAAVGAAARPEAPAATLGSVLLVLALLLAFVVVTRSSLVRPTVSIPSGAFASAGALLAAGVSLTRVIAWLPDLAPRLEAGLTAAALLALAYGGGRMGLAERVRSLLVGLAIAQGGLVGLALLGGVHGRSAVLLQLVTSALAIAFVALGLARRDGSEALTLRDLAAAAAPASARALVVVGVLAALALPPFPGFVARQAAASALLGRGLVASFLAGLALTIALVVGGARLLVAVLDGPSDPRRQPTLAEGLVLAAAFGFVLALGLFPGPLLEAARRGAEGLF